MSNIHYNLDKFLLDYRELKQQDLKDGRLWNLLSYLLVQELVWVARISLESTVPDLERVAVVDKEEDVDKQLGDVIEDLSAVTEVGLVTVTTLILKIVGEDPDFQEVDATQG